MPDLTDNADVQQALEMYHFGYADYNPTIDPAANSIEGHFADLQDQIDFNAATISGGGETNNIEPVLTPTGQTIPDGYVWVDKDANANTVLPTYPPAVYSVTQPTTWGLADKGRIWVNEAVDNAVLNVNDYQLKTQYIPNSPTSPTTGLMWVDSDNGTLYFYTGSAWQEVGGGTSMSPFLLMGA